MSRRQSTRGITQRFSARVLEIRETPEGSLMRIGGHAATFQPAENHNAHGEVHRPGAFANVVAGVKDGSRSLKMLNSHGTPIGVWDEAREDDIGFFVAGNIIDTREGEDVGKLIRGKVLDGLSIGFSYRGSTFEELDVKTSFGLPVIAFTDVDVREVSPTAFASDTFTSVDEIRALRGDAPARPETPYIKPTSEQLILEAIERDEALAAIRQIEQRQDNLGRLIRSKRK